MPDSNLTPEQFAQLMKLTPQDAVDWLMARNLMRETFAWEDVFQAEHNTQFTISRLARVDLLQDIYDGIVANVNGNLSRRDWMRDVEQLLRERGWWGMNEVTDPVTGDVVRTRFDAARLKLILTPTPARPMRQDCGSVRSVPKRPTPICATSPWMMATCAPNIAPGITSPCP